MIINVSDILKEYGLRLKIDGEVVSEHTEFLGEDFVFAKPVSVCGEIFNNGSMLELNADCVAEVFVRCARCAERFKINVPFPVHEFLMQDNGIIPEDEDIIMFSSYSIDITDIIINNFLMNVSGRYLCSEDCKGLCIHCGANLNDGDCGCSDDAVDPRWSSLVDIMKNSSD